MMGQHSARDLDLCSGCLRGQIRRCGLEEEEGCFRNGVVEFLDVVEVVATDGDDLGGCKRERGREEGRLAFLPCLRNWAAAMREEGRARDDGIKTLASKSWDEG